MGYPEFRQRLEEIKSAFQRDGNATNFQIAIRELGVAYYGQTVMDDPNSVGSKALESIIDEAMGLTPTDRAAQTPPESLLQAALKRDTPVTTPLAAGDAGPLEQMLGEGDIDPREYTVSPDLYTAYLGRTRPGMSAFAERAAQDRFSDIKAQFFSDPRMWLSATQDQGDVGDVFTRYLEQGSGRAAPRFMQRDFLTDLANLGTMDNPAASAQQQAALGLFGGDIPGVISETATSNLPFLAAMQPYLMGMAPAMRQFALKAAGRRLQQMRATDPNTNFLQALRQTGFLRHGL